MARAAIVAACVFLLISCDQPDFHQRELFVFGTLNQVHIQGLDKHQASGAFAAINTRFQKMHNDWHAWKPGQLDRLNHQIAHGQAFQVDEGLYELLQSAQDYEHQSQGFFNPAIGNLIRAWGFHTDDYPVTAPPPESNLIFGLLQSKPSSLQLTLSDERVVSSSNTSVRLDFGGLAKGAAVDWAIEHIKATGATGGLVNAGGDLRAFGHTTDRPWRIGIRHPQQGQVLASLEISGDEAIFTSGNYARYKLHEQKRYAHIINPNTGWPLEDIVSATVITDQGIKADAAATALVVAGTDHWLSVLATMQIDQALLVDEYGCIHTTPAMQKRLIFDGREPKCILTARSD